MTADQVIKKCNRRMGDFDNNIFKVEEKLDELNDLLVEVVSRLQCFKKSADIQIQVGRRTYQFPPDMLRLKQMTLETITGEIVFSKSYESIFNQGDIFNQGSTRASAFFAPGTEKNTTRSNFKIFFRELVSDNEFIVDPVLTDKNVNADSDKDNA